MNKHSIRHSIRHRSRRHKRSSRKLNSRRHRYRYSNKSTKRLIRLKRKTRRIKYTRRMRGGDTTTTTSAGATIVIKSPEVQPPNNGSSTSSPNTKLGGGGGGSCMNTKNKQYGGNSILDLYAYKPPPGMMGPVPQPSQDATSNQLILQAAKISTTGQANAQFDDNVKTCKG